MSNKTYAGKPKPLSPQAIQNAQIVQPRPAVGYANKPVPKLFKPISDIVAGWLDPAKESTDGGLLLGEKAMAEYQTPVLNIVAVGPDCKYVKEGERVYVPSQIQGTAVQVGNHRTICIRESSIIGQVITVPADTTKMNEMSDA